MFINTYSFHMYFIVIQSLSVAKYDFHHPSISARLSGKLLLWDKDILLFIHIIQTSLRCFDEYSQKLLKI